MPRCHSAEAGGLIGLTQSILPSSAAAELDRLAEEFAFLTDWEERYGHVIELGRALPALTDAERRPEHKVQGCASQVWLIRDLDGPDGRLRFRGDSDAHIVRGLLALVLRVYSDRSAAEILALEPSALSARLGLSHALSAQRSNGLASVLARIREHAVQALPAGA